MSQVSPIEPMPVARLESRSSGDSLAGLQLVASICMAATAFMPWLKWGLGMSDYNYSQTISLWTVLTGSRDSGSAWMILFAAGAAVALVSSAVELGWHPMGYPARTVAVAGFAAALSGAALGLLVGDETLGAYELPDIQTRTTLELGFWLALGLAAAGTFLSVASRRMPPNPPKMAGQSRSRPQSSSPVLAAPAPVSPDYMAHTRYPEHVSPASAPLYGPAVYPAPGHLTPAYTGGHDELPWQSPDWQATAGGPGSVEEAAVTPGRSPGHLVVVEAGWSTPFTVQPGQRLLIGRDLDAQIRVSDPSVSFRHATIERRGHEWVVQDVDALNPTRIIDQWGTSRPVRGETAVVSAQVVVGRVLVSLYPNGPGAGAS